MIRTLLLLLFFPTLTHAQDLVFRGGKLPSTLMSIPGDPKKPFIEVSLEGHVIFKVTNDGRCLYAGHDGFFTPYYTEENLWRVQQAAKEIRKTYDMLKELPTK